MLPDPTGDQRLVLEADQFPRGLILFPDGSPEQLKAVPGIMVLMLEVEIGLVGAPIRKISQGHMLWLDFMRHKSPQPAVSGRDFPALPCIEINPNANSKMRLFEHFWDNYSHYRVLIKKVNCAALVDIRATIQSPEFFSAEERTMEIMKFSRSY